MYSKRHGLREVLLNGLIDSTLLLFINTISPGSTSLTNSAPIISKPQVSELKTKDPFNFPSTNGLIPKGSLTPINDSLVRRSQEKAPLIECKA